MRVRVEAQILGERRLGPDRIADRRSRDGRISSKFRKRRLIDAELWTAPEKGVVEKSEERVGRRRHECAVPVTNALPQQGALPGVVE